MRRRRDVVMSYNFFKGPDESSGSLSRRARENAKSPRTELLSKSHRGDFMWTQSPTGGTWCISTRLTFLRQSNIKSHRGDLNRYKVPPVGLVIKKHLKSIQFQLISDRTPAECADE